MRKGNQKKLNTGKGANDRKAYLPKLHARIQRAALQNIGGSRMRPVAKYMARFGAIHKNQIKAASRTATMTAPI